MNNEDFKEYLLNEIDTQQIVLEHARKYHITTNALIIINIYKEILRRIC